jgi:hypothetical protein
VISQLEMKFAWLAAGEEIILTVFVGPGITGCECKRSDLAFAL